MKHQACRVCGCTERNACKHTDTGRPCYWVEKDLCSACVTVPFAQPPDPPFWCPKHNLKYGPDPKECPTCTTCNHDWVAYTWFKRCKRCGREIKTRKDQNETTNN